MFPLPIVAIFICLLSLAWLKKLDRVACRVVNEDLLAARTLDDLVSERDSGRTQPLDLGGEIVDQEVDPVPAAWLRLASVGHRPRSRALRTAEQEPEAPTLDVGERRRIVRQQLEAEVRCVEGDRRLHVVDHVPDVNGFSGHAPGRYRAAISAEPSTIRPRRGTTSRTLTCAQNAMSSSSPGGPYVRARRPSCASGQARAIASAAFAESDGSAPSSCTIRPAQYASSSANVPWNPAQTISTSSPRSRAAAATALRLSRLPSSTSSARAAVSRIVRVPFVVEKMTVEARGSPRNSRGDAPTSKPSIRTAFRSPPSSPSPSRSRSARASSISRQQ